MTFKEYLETTEGATLYTGLDIDDSTRESLAAWYESREIVPDGFRGYYRRELSISIGRYYELLRLESAKVDWAISQYVERLTEDTRTDTTKTDTTATKTGTEKRENTDTKTGTEKRTETGESHDTDSATRETSTSSEDSRTTKGSDDSTTTTSGTGSDTTKGATKVSPQSIAYSSADAGRLPDLDWQYMSQQQQTEQDHATESSSETQGSKTETASGTASGSGKETTTGTKTGTTSRTVSGDTTATDTGSSTAESSSTDTGTSSGESTTSGTVKEISAGRSGEIAEIFKRAAHWIKDSSALQWLLGRLDTCFVMVYDD